MVKYEGKKKRKRKEKSPELAQPTPPNEEYVLYFLLKSEEHK